LHYIILGFAYAIWSGLVNGFKLFDNCIAWFTSLCLNMPSLKNYFISFGISLLDSSHLI
jgi:hypothetical protein